ncbi:MAG: hypothetical protein ACI9QD_001241, partial [Thermoproteota archaeon]
LFLEVNVGQGRETNVKPMLSFSYSRKFNAPASTAPMITR